MKTHQYRQFRMPAQFLLCMAGLLIAQISTHAGTVPNGTVNPLEQPHEAESSSPGRHVYARTGAEFEVIDSLPESIENTNADSDVPVTVDINSASVDELAAALPGIGPGKAQRIVDWRETNGPFQTIEQLLEVSGIGPVTLENIRPFVRIGDVVSMKRNLHRQSMQEQAVVLALAKVIQRAVSDRAEVLKTARDIPE